MTQNARVYIDETGHMKSNVFGLVAVFVRLTFHDELKQKWLSLQQQILTEIQSSPQGYELAKAFFQQHPDELPEIHAADLINPSSKGYDPLHPKRELIYRKYPRGQEGLDELYWQRHVRWLEMAFELQDQYRLPLLLLAGDYDTHDPKVTKNLTMTQLFSHWDAPEAQYPDFLAALAKMDEFQARPITWAVPQMLFAIQKELARRDWRAEVIFDDSSDNRGYRTSALFNYLQEKQHLPNISGLFFKHSHLDSLLQIPDIHAYVFGYLERITRENKTPNRRDKDIIWMARYYLQRQMQHTHSHNSSESERLWGKLLAYEYIIKNAGKKDIQTKALLWFVRHFERMTGIFSAESTMGKG